MAKISVKYPIGSKIRTVYKGSPDGVVTAIFIRGKNKVYEVGYLDNQGNPTSRNAEEVELEPIKEDVPLGFKK